MATIRRAIKGSLEGRQSQPSALSARPPPSWHASRAHLARRRLVLALLLYRDLGLLCVRPLHAHAALRHQNLGGPAGQPVLPPQLCHLSAAEAQGAVRGEWVCCVPAAHGKELKRRGHTRAPGWNQACVHQQDGCREADPRACAREHRPLPCLARRPAPPAAAGTAPPPPPRRSAGRWRLRRRSSAGGRGPQSWAAPPRCRPAGRHRGPPGRPPRWRRWGCPRAGCGAEGRGRRRWGRVGWPGQAHAAGSTRGAPGPTAGGRPSARHACWAAVWEHAQAACRPPEGSLCQALGEHGDHPGGQVERLAAAGRLLRQRAARGNPAGRVGDVNPHLRGGAGQWRQAAGGPGTREQQRRIGQRGLMLRASLLPSHTPRTPTLTPPSGSRSKLSPSSISVVDASSIVYTVWEVRSRRRPASGSGGGAASSCCASACEVGMRRAGGGGWAPPSGRVVRAAEHREGEGRALLPDTGAAQCCLPGRTEQPCLPT